MIGFVSTWRAGGNCSALLKAFKTIVRKDAGLLWVLFFFIALDFVLLGNVAIKSICYFSNRRDPCKSWLRLSSLRRPNRDIVH